MPSPVGSYQSLNNVVPKTMISFICTISQISVLVLISVIAPKCNPSRKALYHIGTHVKVQEELLFNSVLLQNIG